MGTLVVGLTWHCSIISGALQTAVRLCLPALQSTTFPHPLRHTPSMGIRVYPTPHSLNRVTPNEMASQLKLAADLHEGLEAGYHGNVIAPEHVDQLLRQHSNDSRDGPFTCKLCMKLITTMTNLKKHYKIHAGDRPYKCRYCGKSFSQGGNLKDHVRIHTGEKPYRCDLCGKAFRRRNNLTTHMILHNTEGMQ